MTLIDGDRIITAQLYDDEYEEFKEEKMSIIDYVNAYTTEGVTEADIVEQTRWIPVSERLPEAEYGESGSVLVCFENETQDVLYFDGSNWRYPTGEIYVSINHKNGWHNKVIAWMPLPKPYEPKESEEISERNMKMWEDIFKAERSDKE